MDLIHFEKIKYNKNIEGKIKEDTIIEEIKYSKNENNI